MWQAVKGGGAARLRLAISVYILGREACDCGATSIPALHT